MVPSALERDNHLVLVTKQRIWVTKTIWNFSTFWATTNVSTPCSGHVFFILVPASNYTSGMFGFYAVESGLFIPTFQISILPPSSVPKTKYYNSRSWYSIVYYFFTRLLSVCYMMLCRVDAIHSQTSEKTREKNPQTLHFALKLFT